MQTQTFKVAGMTCGGCVRSVTNAIKNIEAVGDAKVTLETGNVEVLFNPDMMTSLEVHDAVQEAIEKAGFEVVPNGESSQPRQGGCCG